MSEKVHIRVGEGRKAKWDTHAKEDYADKYGSMSKLIRHAVERQIEVDVGEGGGESEGAQTAEPNGRIDDILNGVEDNGSALEAIQDRLENMHDTMLSQGGIPDKVFSDVYGALPTVENGFEGADKDAVAERFGATAAEIAEDAGVSELEAARTLVQLHYEDDYSGVQMLMTRDFEGPRYWLEVGQ
ncbi:hypothetical protein PNP85_12560 [Halobacterium salinarum]|uniref:hypothetical protein n=1 Tax=Halobacterium salinarum TaxID=2242 RepID=UPI0025523A3F|nr:hypothetical protein [Halobacterium salinarum]MDL0140335.1 hypothetical protein [Halobacterium salinarum]